MCAIFGVLDYKGTLEAAQRLRMVRELGKAAEIRGTDATGIAYFQHNKLHIQKAPKPAHKMRYRIPADVRYIMGHTRMTTQGEASRNQNNHPFPGKAGNVQFALAHNGVITNDQELQKDNSLPKTNVETDSFVAVQLIEKQKEVSFNSLKQAVELLRGHFTFTILDQNDNLYFIKGNNPLCIYHYPKLGLYLYASTEDILQIAVWRLKMDRLQPRVIQPGQGDILLIDCEGHQQLEKFDDIAIADDFGNWWMDINYRYSRFEKEHWAYILEIGQSLGIPESELELLSQAGYSFADIEELLYDDVMRGYYLEEAKRELEARSVC